MPGGATLPGLQRQCKPDNAHSPPGIFTQYDACRRCQIHSAAIASAN
ncbi:hypothetical protein LTSEWAN_4596, partial [Salmonella enterica subsp. enterica serovar Wandsworth str. A4-580]